MLIIILNIRDLRKELRVFILNNLKKLSLQIKSKKMNGYVKDKIVKQSTKLIWQNLTHAIVQIVENIMKKFMKCIELIDIILNVKMKFYKNIIKLR